MITNLYDWFGAKELDLASGVPSSVLTPLHGGPLLTDRSRALRPAGVPGAPPTAFFLLPFMPRPQSKTTNLESLEVGSGIRTFRGSPDDGDVLPGRENLGYGSGVRDPALYNPAEPCLVTCKVVTVAQQLF